MGNPPAVVVSGGEFAPILLKDSPSARARKFLGIWAFIKEAYELEDESEENDVSDSEPDSDSESDL